MKERKHEKFGRRGTVSKYSPNFLGGGIEEEIETITRKSYEMSKYSLCKSRTRHYIILPGVFFRGQWGLRTRGERGGPAVPSRFQKPATFLLPKLAFLAAKRA